MGLVRVVLFILRLDTNQFFLKLSGFDLRLNICYCFDYIYCVIKS